MAERAGEEPRYSEEETALILRRAAEVELRQALPAGGHTLDELADIAREAGIDPDAVRRASRLLPARAAPVQRVLTGEPSHGYVRAHFPGTLPPARVPEAREVIERDLGRSGTLHHDATSLLWREDHGVGRTYVRVRRESDGTHVEVEADRRGHLLALVLVLATAVAVLLQPLGGFAGLAALVGPLLSATLPVAAVLAGTRAFWPSLARPTLRRAETTAMDLGALVEPPSGGSAAGDGEGTLPPGDQPPPPSGSGGAESGGSANR